MMREISSVLCLCLICSITCLTTATKPYGHIPLEWPAWDQQGNTASENEDNGNRIFDSAAIVRPVSNRNTAAGPGNPYGRNLVAVPMDIQEVMPSQFSHG